MNNVVDLMLKEEKSLKEIATKLEISHYKLKKYYLTPRGINGYKRYGNFKIVRKRRSEIGKIIYSIDRDSTCFKKIDSEIKAYLLGLIAADGNISNNSVSLGSKDLELINIFSFYFNSKVRVDKDIYRSRFGDYLIAADLKKLGLRENKSTVKGLIKLFINILDKFKRHFVRGFLDGDGSVSSKYSVRFYNTDRDLLQGICNFITPTKYCIRESPKKNQIVYVLTIWRKEDFFKIYHLLYDDCNYCLGRKKNKFLDVKRLEFQHGLQGVAKSEDIKKKISLT